MRRWCVFKRSRVDGRIGVVQKDTVCNLRIDLLLRHRALGFLLSFRATPEQVPRVLGIGLEEREKDRTTVVLEPKIIGIYWFLRRHPAPQQS